MKKPPATLYATGNTSLLSRQKISIVGSRKPSSYSRTQIHTIASLIGKQNIVVVSGGAIGIDALAHLGAGACNTIAVLPCGINERYPSINKKLLDEIASAGLLLSHFEPDFQAKPWSFVERNELVVALGDVLVVAEADMDSGTMRSVEFALKMKKEIFVLPQRLGESLGTQELLKKGFAQPIYDIFEFVAKFAPILQEPECDEFLLFCKTNPTYDEALKLFAGRLFEAELGGEIEVVNGRVRPIN